MERGKYVRRICSKGIIGYRTEFVSVYRKTVTEEQTARWHIERLRDVEHVAVRFNNNKLE